MKTVEIASERGLEKFLSAQLEIYSGQVRDHYGLPDPNSIREPYFRIPVASKMRVAGMAHQLSTDVEWIEFHKKNFMLFDKIISFWVKQ